MSRDEPGADDAERLVEMGHCCRCEAWAETLAVALVERGSGPGYIVRACIPHAREMATYPSAPAWLRTDLAALDAARAKQLGNAS
ncbi:hypothetical protein [Streptomyces iconiensis]|uniref:(2Fe-2S)-binding protein n=1 Tax=Streptomyces iconiensis TaxID=1384038 RepID=A0ABT6ZRU2_9ACTN|nr:hypothetical protein [Streptomyces iconiensis]MDJ1131775.1 hypothetical protein [Streptomyces iconiensis]